MKTQHALSIVAGILLASTVSSAQAGEYQFRHYLSGLKQASTSTPEEPEQDENWTLSSATLPRAVTNQAYSYSFYDLVTPNGLTGFQWAGSGLPAWASLNAITGELTGTPSESDTGSSSFAVFATQGGINGQQVYTINVGGELLDVVKISAGYSFSCAVTTSGAAKCWGRNQSGELGNNTLVSSLTPVQVFGLETGVVDIYTGTSHACALLQDKSAYCWGSNSSYQIMTSSGDNYSKPRKITTGADYLLLGGSYTCYGSERHLSCMGANSSGQLGTRNTNTPTYPVATQLGMAITAEERIVSASAGSTHTCIVSSTGEAYCWGNNASGALGVSSTTGIYSSPTQVQNLPASLKMISVGITSTCAVTVDGAALCWGGNTSGQVGYGSVSTRVYYPRQVTGLESGVSSVTVSQNSACALMQDGGVKCWGNNKQGQLGNGGNEDSYTPVSVVGLAGRAVQLSARGHSFCARLEDNTAQCWGDNGHGNLGNGSSTSMNSPVDVKAN